MSLALFGFMFLSVFVTISSVVCCSSKGGSWLLFDGCAGLSWLGIVLLVLCPMVMKKSFNEFAMSVGLVYVWFSYVMVVGDLLFCLLFGMILFRIFACLFGLCFVVFSCVMI
jgi:hypothetical protein